MITLFTLKQLLRKNPPPLCAKPVVSFGLLDEKVKILRENEASNNILDTSDCSDVTENIPQDETNQLNPPSQSQTMETRKIRSEIFVLGAKVGDFCNKILLYAPYDGDDTQFWKRKSKEKEEISMTMGNIFLSLFLIAQLCQLDLLSCIIKKMQLNEKKYPVELCKGKAGKYTVYSDETGITKTSGQSTLHSDYIISEESYMNSSSILDVTLLIRTFASERNWEIYHTPRNIALALMGEFGELTELFQWKGDKGLNSEGEILIMSDEEKDHVGQELADISIYLIRLSDICNIDLGGEALKL